MSTSNPFSRVLSIRDKRRPQSKPRHPADYHGLFTLQDQRRKVSREEDKKITELTQRLHAVGLQDVSEPRLEYVLKAKSTNGDVKEAFKLLMVFEDSIAGVLKAYDPKVKMLGAENREKTTCYLDALLFALFASEDVFEPVLCNSFEDEPRRRLVLVLRLWVNMLRTGRLITTDITQQLQESLAACGWADAACIRQQDASEAFGFIMDKLQMPLVTLKTDIYHAGKEDATDDHKFITERLLEVAIPENVPKGETITLEMCLEEYFNNRVEVKRAIQRRTTMQSARSPAIASSSARSSLDKGGAVFIESVEIESQDASPGLGELPNNKFLQRPGLSLRNRTPSIFGDRRPVTDGEGNEPASTLPSGRNRAASVKKEILMPAWQFLNLIPWYTDNNSPNDKDVAAHLASKRPMLGICLKRYMMTPKGASIRLDTHIDIPLEIISPHFEDEGDLSGNYKLVLQAVVCHRGISTHSGHYVALVRTPSSTSRRSDDTATSTGSIHSEPSRDTWVRCDDLAHERVVPIDIKRALVEESPYLLFYRIQPVVEEAFDDQPPMYEESADVFTSLDEKLQTLPQSSRPSFDYNADLASRRASIDHSSDGRYPRSSTSEGRRVSYPSTNPGLTSEQLPTEPTTPLDDSKGSSGFMMSRQSTNKSARLATHGFGDTSNKRFSLSMAKLTSRLGGDKSSNPEIVVDEVHGEYVPPITHALPITTHDDITFSSPEDIKTKTKAPEKAEKKKKTFMTMSRRGSNDKHSKRSKDEERECIVM